MDNKRTGFYPSFSLKWRKRGPWDKKGDLKEIQIHKKVPQATQMGTVQILLVTETFHMGATAGMLILAHPAQTSRQPILPSLSLVTLSGK